MPIKRVSSLWLKDGKRDKQPDYTLHIATDDDQPTVPQSDKHHRQPPLSANEAELAGSDSIPF